jgi:hypothetical protein
MLTPTEATTYQEAAQNRDHRAMMKHPEWWICWPLLPLTRRGKADMGVMCEGFPNTVFLTTLFLFNPREDRKLEYPSIEALLADGWVVD